MDGPEAAAAVHRLFSAPILAKSDGEPLALGARLPEDITGVVQDVLGQLASRPPTRWEDIPLAGFADQAFDFAINFHGGAVSTRTHGAMVRLAIRKRVHQEVVLGWSQGQPTAGHH